MTILALDPSKSSTGFAVGGGGLNAPMVGHWCLGSEITPEGRVFNKLLQCLGDLHKVVRFEHIYFEQKINPANLSGQTNYSTLSVLGGLETIIKTFGYARKMRTCKAVDVGQWRPAFIGKIDHTEAKRKARALRLAGDKRASARKDLKALTKERCRLLGFEPRNDDEADAIGILTYAMQLRGETPPWWRDEALLPLMASAA